MHYFEFEKGFIENGLACIPMCVRMQLDLVGIKLSLKQWSCLDLKDRIKIAGFTLDTKYQRKAFEEYLEYVFGLEKDHLVRITPLQFNHETKIETFITLKDKLGDSDERLSWKNWNSLTSLQRFAISKLLRPGHESKNLLPALREFGLLSKSAIPEFQYEEYSK